MQHSQGARGPGSQCHAPNGRRPASQPGQAGHRHLVEDLWRAQRQHPGGQPPDGRQQRRLHAALLAKLSKGVGGYARAEGAAGGDDAAHGAKHEVEGQLQERLQPAATAGRPAGQARAGWRPRRCMAAQPAACTAIAGVLAACRLANRPPRSSHPPVLGHSKGGRAAQPRLRYHCRQHRGKQDHCDCQP